MKKRLNVDSVTNELRGGSAFFPSYREAKPAAPPSATATSQRTPHSSPEQLPVTPSHSTEPVAQPQNHVSTEPRFHGTVEPRNHGNVVLPSVSETPVVDAENGLDISEKADIKHTFEFTNAELETLDDIKINLRREADLRIAKNDIVRLGIHVLAKDYKRRKAASIIVTTLGKKK